MPGIDMAGRVDDKGDGQSENASVLFGRFRIAHDYWIVHVKLVVEVADRIGRVVHRDSNYLQSVGAVLVLHLYEMRNFFAAGIAPGRPEIEQNYLPAIGGQANFFAVQIAQGKIRGKRVRTRVARIIRQFSRRKWSDGNAARQEREHILAEQSYSPLATG